MAVLHLLKRVRVSKVSYRHRLIVRRHGCWCCVLWRNGKGTWSLDL
jgi:hypothetical protein